MNEFDFLLDEMTIINFFESFASQLAGRFFFVAILVPFLLIAFYIYFSICWHKIGEKLQHPYPWIGWVNMPLVAIAMAFPLAMISPWFWLLFLAPMLQFVPTIALIQFSESPWWWYFLMWIPLVNLVLLIIMLAKTYERLGRPSWWCIFYLIPLVHLIMIGLAAFGEGEIEQSYSDENEFRDDYPPVGNARNQPDPRTSYQGVTPKAYGAMVIVDGPNKGQSFRLTPGSTNVIGRAGNIQLPIDDRTASREHARIRDENGKFVLYDLGSTNKTSVNDQYSDRKVLMDGDVIKTGRTKFKFTWIRNR